MHLPPATLPQRERIDGAILCLQSVAIHAIYVVKAHRTGVIAAIPRYVSDRLRCTVSVDRREWRCIDRDAGKRLSRGDARVVGEQQRMPSARSDLIDRRSDEPDDVRYVKE